jgi:hypothetical protein
VEAEIVQYVELSFIILTDSKLITQGEVSEEELATYLALDWEGGSPIFQSEWLGKEDPPFLLNKQLIEVITSIFKVF